MLRRGIVILTGVVGFVSAGCAGSTQGEDARSRGETTGHTEPTHLATTIQEPSRSGPPDSTLSYGDQSVTGTIGTYCWTSGGTGTCADAASPGVGAAAKMLRIAQGSVMIFDYGGRGNPDSVGPAAYPIGRGNKLVDMDGFRFLQPSEGRSTWRSEDLRVVRGADDQTEIPAELPPGGYIVEVFVTVPEGDVSYDFLVSVEEEAG